jgi:FkbM family methyltransferase
VVDEHYFLNVGPNDVVIDAGAYVGDFTVRAAARAKLVIAVEPNPGSVELLRRNVRGLGNMVIVEAALGEGPGITDLVGSRILAHVEPGRGDRVKVVALDDLMEERGGRARPAQDGHGGWSAPP